MTNTLNSTITMSIITILTATMTILTAMMMANTIPALKNAIIVKVKAIAGGQAHPLISIIVMAVVYAGTVMERVMNTMDRHVIIVISLERFL